MAFIKIDLFQSTKNVFNLSILSSSGCHYNLAFIRIIILGLFRLVFNKMGRKCSKFSKYFPCTLENFPKGDKEVTQSVAIATHFDIKRKRFKFISLFNSACCKELTCFCPFNECLFSRDLIVLCTIPLKQ